jgi:lipoprotein-releasing system permease protein
MPYELKVAFRYLASSRLQTSLILAGVAVGIVAFTFMAALINGLETSLTEDVIGNIAHVTLEPADRIPRLIEPPEGARALVAVQRGSEPRPQIPDWRRLEEQIESTPGVRSVAPQVEGSGFLRRGERILPIAFTGAPEGKLSTIVDVEGNLVRGGGRGGAFRLGPDDLLVGVGVAEELGVTLGQRLLLESERGRQRSLTVRGIFDVGGMINDQVVFVDLSTAQSLMELEGSVSVLKLKVTDIYAAPRIARRLAGATGLRAESWIEQNERLQEALTAQGRTGTLIEIFSLLTIVIGVASVLLLSVVRRQGEIGILRSFGVSKRSVSAVFVLQGLLLGLLGSSAGAGLGWLFCRLLLAVTRGPGGEAALPVDPSRGEYATAILLATAAGALAAILPARRAATVDPVEVIQH